MKIAIFFLVVLLSVISCKFTSTKVVPIPFQSDDDFSGTVFIYGTEVFVLVETWNATGTGRLVVFDFQGNLQDSISLPKTCSGRECRYSVVQFVIEGSTFTMLVNQYPSMIFVTVDLDAHKVLTTTPVGDEFSYASILPLNFPQALIVWQSHFVNYINISSFDFTSYSHDTPLQVSPRYIMVPGSFYDPTIAKTSFYACVNIDPFGTLNFLTISTVPKYEVLSTTKVNCSHFSQYWPNSRQIVDIHESSNLQITLVSPQGLTPLEPLTLSTEEYAALVATSSNYAFVGTTSYIDQTRGSFYQVAIGQGSAKILDTMPVPDGYAFRYLDDEPSQNQVSEAYGTVVLPLDSDGAVVTFLIATFDSN